LASENLGPNVTSLDAWLNAFIDFNSFMSIAYTCSQVSELHYRNELAARRTPRHYASRIEAAMAARCGETEAARALRQYQALLQEARHKPSIKQSLRSAVESQSPRKLNGEFAERLRRYATEFKVTKHIDFTLTRDFAAMQVANTLLRDIERDRQVHLPPKPVDEGEYYPGHDRFHRAAGLCFEVARMRQDAHHQRVRGMWRFLDGLASMLPDSARFPEGNDIEQLFHHSYQWLLDRISSCQNHPQDVFLEAQCAT
jgi:hypothetical protein